MSSRSSSGRSAGAAAPSARCVSRSSATRSTAVTASCRAERGPFEMLSETYQTPGRVLLNLAIPTGVIEIDTAPGETTQVELDALTDSARELLTHTRLELRERGGGHEVMVEVPSTRSSFFISFGR